MDAGALDVRAVCWLAAAALGAAPGPAAAPDGPRLGLAPFFAPVRIAGAAPAAECGECHPAALEAWSRSLHKASVTNPVFTAGFAAEPHLRCLVCHAPEERQVRDAARARRDLTSLPAASPAREGITCTTCHLRDGEVLAARASADPAHAVRVEPGFAGAALCAECHEFEGHAQTQGRTVLTGELLQTTFSEWRAWGGKESCVDCHGAHEVKGAYDLDFLRGALGLEVGRDAQGAFAELWAVNVGHRFPTGDVFRRLALSADGEVLAVYGRRYAARTRDDGLVVSSLSEDSSLEPGRRYRVRLPPGARSVAVSYLYARGPSPAVVLAERKVGR